MEFSTNLTGALRSSSSECCFLNNRSSDAESAFGTAIYSCQKSFILLGTVHMKRGTLANLSIPCSLTSIAVGSLFLTRELGAPILSRHEMPPALGLGLHRLKMLLFGHIHSEVHSAPKPR